ncbi:MAG: alpha/beta fold hydrolase [Planctomycetota bacterium]
MATPSPLSTALGRITLTAGNYPGRRVLGAAHRKASRRRGGRCFLVERPGGVTLDAWHSPRDPHAASRPPVVLVHGLFEVKELHFKRARRLNADGHDVLLFDHRVHGRSSGKRLTFGVEEKRDVAAVIDSAVERGLIDPDASGGKVITMGFSLGGGTVLQHAAIDPRVAGVIALAPFADFRGAINSFRRRLAPWLDERWVMDGFTAASEEAGFRLDEASALTTLRDIDARVLLVEGGKDPVLPGAEHVHRLAAELPDDRVEVLRIADANHNRLMHKHWPELEAAITRFCAACGDDAFSG